MNSQLKYEVRIADKTELDKIANIVCVVVIKLHRMFWYYRIKNMNKLPDSADL